MVGGAVRNALLGEPVGDIDIATTAMPDEVIAPGRGGRLQGGADRHRARHRHGRGRRPAVRGDDLARGRRDLRAPRQGGVRPRLAARCRAARLHHQRALGRAPTAPSTTMSAGLPISRARRVRFIGEPATRIAEDYLRILRFFRFHAAYGEGAPDAGGLAACIAARAGLDSLSRERVRMEMLKLLLGAARGAGAGGDGGGRPAAAGARRRAAAGELREHGQDRGGAGACGRSGAPAGRARAFDRRGRGAAVRAAAALQCGARAARRDGGRLVARSRPRRRAGRPRAALSARAASVSPIGCCWPGRARRPAPHDTAWHELATPAAALDGAGISAQGRRLHRSAASPRARRSARRCAPPRQAWIAADFPTDAADVAAIADAAARRATRGLIRGDPSARATCFALPCGVR